MKIETRYVFWGGVAVSILLLAYCVWPFIGARQVAVEAKRGEVAGLMQRVDMPALRWSFVKQFVHAVLRQSGRYRKLNSIERSLASDVGLTIADGYLKELLTPQNIITLLHRGHVDLGDPDVGTIEMPRLAEIWQKTPINTLVGSYFDALNGFVVVLGSGEETYGLHLRLHGTEWWVSGLDMPNTFVDQLAHRLIARQPKKTGTPPPAPAEQQQ